MDSLDKLVVRLVDWLLYNQWDIEKAIHATDYQVSSKWEKDYVVYRSQIDSFVERFVASQDYHLNIVLTVRSAIFLLDSDYFDIYSMRYVDYKTMDEMANMISVSSRTIKRKVMDIREHTWRELQEEGIFLESIVDLRKKYWYIPRKEKTKK